MLRKRVLPLDVERAYRKPRRALRSTEGRSLDNCNHLATSDTNPESFAAEFARRGEARRKRANQLAMHSRLTESLKVIATRGKAAVDLDYSRETLHGQPDAEKGAWDAAKDYRRLMNCQSEWIGFKARCCNSPAVAVPIGCNHRLCPLCSAGRLEHYRGPARKMLDAMKNPSFLTLTVPNSGDLTRGTFTQIRKWWKEFRRSNELVGGEDSGGLYAIETTFNREEGTWHPHLHILFDSPFPIHMAKADFIRLKRRMEFSWLKVTNPVARKKFGGKAGFFAWMEESKKQTRGSEWNRENRRIVDLRPVRQGDGAVHEVIKYISKTTRFIDLPDAVETYLKAVRGVRVFQTFGRFYNFKFEEDTNPATFLKCECGTGDFERLGVYDFSSVYQSETGCWFLKTQLHNRPRCRSGPTK